MQETAWAFSLKETFSSYLLKSCVEGTTSVVRMKQLGNVTENVTEINEKKNNNKRKYMFLQICSSSAKAEIFSITFFLRYRGSEEDIA